MRVTNERKVQPESNKPERLKKGKTDVIILLSVCCNKWSQIKRNGNIGMEYQQQYHPLEWRKKNYVISTIPTLIKPYVDTILLQLNWWNQSLLFHTLCVSFLLLLFRLVLSLSISFSFCLFRHRFHRIQLNTPYVFCAIHVHRMQVKTGWSSTDKSASNCLVFIFGSSHSHSHSVYRIREIWNIQSILSQAINFFV